MTTWDDSCPELYTEKEKTGGPAKGRKSLLPDASRMARMLRSGRTVSDLAVRYGVNPRVISARLSTSGWNPKTGENLGGIKLKPIPLTDRGDGAGRACHHVGGGENPNVVPTSRVVHRGTPRPTGFRWPKRPEPIAEVVLPTPAPKLYDTRPRNTGGRRPKLTADQRSEVARRYLEGESSGALGAEYGVNQSTICATLRSLGVPIRNHSEATLMRHARSKDVA